MKKIFLISLFLLNILFWPRLALADTTTAQDPKFNYVKLDNPLKSAKTPTDILGQVIKVAMSVMGGAVLLMVVKGAASWITAGGNSESIQSGTQTILWAVIGAVLTITSYIILNTIIQFFSKPNG